MATLSPYLSPAQQAEKIIDTLESLDASGSDDVMLRDYLGRLVEEFSEAQDVIDARGFEL